MYEIYAKPNGRPRAKSVREPQVRERAQDAERYRSNAAYYALLLRTQGHTPKQAAELVAERYPRLRDVLKRVISDGEPPKAGVPKDENATGRQAGEESEALAQWTLNRESDS